MREQPLTRVILDDPGQAQTDQPISERLFAQFFEHMAAATSGGLSAELLTNPTLVRDPALTADQVQTLRDNERLVQAWLRGDSGPMRERWTSAPLHGGFPVTLVEEPRDGVPMGWSPLGPGRSVTSCPARLGDGMRVLGSSDATGLHTDVAMLDEAPGLRQGIRVPAERCQHVSVRVVARADSGTGTMEVLLRRRARGAGGPIGEVLSRSTVAVESTDWHCSEHQLHVPADISGTELVDLFVRWHAARGSDLVIDRVSAMPADHMSGLDPDVVEMATSAGITELRWPGGNFASHYHWYDGVGPQDLRPTRLNHAWGGIEQNQIGTEEFLRFCRIIGAEPHITVNSGTGSPHEAADWVEYCNGSVDTPMGALRAQHGHPEPYGVHIWEVGNENFGTWQGGFVGSEENARRFTQFAAAMRAASPIPLELHACGNAFDFDGQGRGLDNVVADGRWHTELLRQAPDDVDVISLHALPVNDALLDGLSEEQVHQALMAYVVTAERSHIPRLLAECDSSARRPDLPPVRISWTEWGPVGARRDRVRCENAGGSVWGLDFLGMLTRMGDRIAMASPNGLLHGGAIKKGGGVVYADPVFDVVRRMRRLAGHYPLGARMDGPTFDVTQPTDLGAPERDVQSVGVTACTTSGSVTCILVSRRLTGGDIVRVRIPHHTDTTSITAECWWPQAVGVHASPADPAPVTWVETPISLVNDDIEVELPAGAAIWIEAFSSNE